MPIIFSPKCDDEHVCFWILVYEVLISVLTIDTEHVKRFDFLIFAKKNVNIFTVVEAEWFLA